MLPEVIDIHLNTRLEHDIEDADLTQSLNSVAALKQMKTIGTYDTSHNDKPDNTRDTYLAAHHRHYQNDGKQKGNDD